ncbi:MAG: methionyl-tRNA formyltransferase [Pelagibacteraceae bacterium]
MKIAFMGTPRFAVPALKKINQIYKIDTVFTQPPRKSKRGMKELISPVHEISNELNLNVRTPNNLNEDLEFFKVKKFNLVVVAAYGQIISDDFLKECLFINIHASILPRWRGAAPIQRSIMNKDKFTGISIMKIEKELDSGPVLFTESFPLHITSKHGDVENKLAEIGSELIVKAIEKIDKNDYEFKEQNHNLKTYAKKITKEDEEIIWDLEAENVIAKIHALSPSPGSYFNYNGEKLKIFECILSDKITKKIGHIIVKDDSLFIACKDKYIEILEIQKPGKNKQKIKEFLKGYNFN